MKKKLDIYDIAAETGMSVPKIYSELRLGNFPKADNQGKGSLPSTWDLKTVKAIISKAKQEAKKIESGEIIDFNEVTTILGMSRETIYRRINNDPDFPKKMTLSTNDRKSYWKKSDIEKYKAK